MNRGILAFVFLIFVSVGSGFIGYSWKASQCNAEQSQAGADQAKATTEAIKDVREGELQAQATTTGIETARAERAAEREGNFAKLKEQAAAYEKAKHDRDDCIDGLDADGVRIWNEANSGAGQGQRQHSTGPADAVPRDAAATGERKPGGDAVESHIVSEDLSRLRGFQDRPDLHGLFPGVCDDQWFEADAPAVLRKGRSGRIANQFQCASFADETSANLRRMSVNFTPAMNHRFFLTG